MFRKYINIEILNINSNENGCMLLINIKMNVEVINVYSPNSETDRISFYGTVDFSLNINKIVIAGDFNYCLLDTDRQPKTHLKDKSRPCLKELLKTNSLVDTLHLPNISGRFTFTDKQHGTKSRLDYIFASQN